MTQTFIGPVSYTGNLSWLKDGTILFSRHGSHAYGTNVPTSDQDFKGIAIPPKNYFFGMDRFEQAEFKDIPNNSEATIYDIRKFCKLAADCNPNIIEVLWSDPSDYIIMTQLGEELVNNRDMFLSKKARFTFAGYAHAQLKRIRLHYEWNKYGENVKEPTREDFKLPKTPDYSVDQKDAAVALVQKKLSHWNLNDMEELDSAQRILVMNGVQDILDEMQLGTETQRWNAAVNCLGFETNFVEYLDKERRFRAAERDWKAFLEWKKTRNPTRAALEKKFSYDTKHGGHLVRLMRMCGEILDTGKVIVKRPDYEELLEIRNGAWSYERLMEFAESEDLRMDEKYKTSKLQKSVDFKKVNDLCVQLVENFDSPLNRQSVQVSP
jgi:hypothetical protein